MNPAEKGRIGELPQFRELRPTQSVVDVLRGTVSLIPFKRKIPGQDEKQPMSAILAVEGPGMFGLTDWRDNKLWAGIFNHSILSARYSLYLAEQLAKKGFTVNPQRVLDGMIVSHAGRRQWDEAGLYPEAIPKAKSKRKISNERLGLRLIKGKVPDGVFELVAALGHEIDAKEFPIDPKIYESLDYSITEYVDHRTAQKYEPLHTRMGDFLLGKFFKKEVIDSDPDLKKRVYEFTSGIIERRKASYLKKSKQGITIEQADQEAEDLGASVDSDRLTRIDLIRLILHDAETEAFLERKGIDTNLIDKLVPMPEWERDLRKVYVGSAKPGIRLAIDSGGLKIDFNNPKDWWEEFAIEVLRNG